MSCARFGTQRGSPVPFIILLVSDTLVPRLNYSPPLPPPTPGRSGASRRGARRKLSTSARVLYGDAHFYSNNRTASEHTLALPDDEATRCGAVA